MSKKPKTLFHCTGNSCRSQITVCGNANERRPFFRGRRECSTPASTTRRSRRSSKRPRGENNELLPQDTRRDTRSSRIFPGFLENFPEGKRSLIKYGRYPQLRERTVRTGDKEQILMLRLGRVLRRNHVRIRHSEHDARQLRRRDARKNSRADGRSVLRLRQSIHRSARPSGRDRPRPGKRRGA